MGRFMVVHERSSRSLEKVGRFRVERENIEIYLNGIGSFPFGRAQVILVIPRLGDEVIQEWKGSDDSYSGAVVCGSSPEGKAAIGGEGEEGGGV